MDINQVIELAYELQIDGKLEEAEKIYKEILELVPSDAGVYYNLGIISQEKGNLNEALTYYQKALEI